MLLCVAGLSNDRTVVAAKRPFTVILFSLARKRSADTCDRCSDILKKWRPIR